MFIKKKSVTHHWFLAFFIQKSWKSDCDKAVQFPPSVWFHLKVNFRAINSSWVGMRVTSFLIFLSFFFTKGRVFSKFLAYLHSLAISARRLFPCCCTQPVTGAMGILTVKRFLFVMQASWTVRCVLWSEEDWSGLLWVVSILFCWLSLWTQALQPGMSC